MKAKNFRVRDAIYIVHGGHECDLHNCYDFRSFAYDIRNRRLLLRWAKAEAEWINKDLPSNLVLTFRKVTSLELRPRTPALPFTEDDCLASIGHLSDALGVPGVFISNDTPDDEWKWVFEFQSRAQIIVQAESVEAITDPEQQTGGNSP